MEKPRFETTEERIAEEIRQVVELMRERFPKADDYTVNSRGTIAFILDKKGKKIGQIDSDELDAIWNRILGAESDEDDERVCE